MLRRIAFVLLLTLFTVSASAQHKRKAPVVYQLYRLELQIFDKQGQAVSDGVKFSVNHAGTMNKVLWTYENLSAEDILLGRGPVYLANIWQYEFEAASDEELTIEVCSNQGYGKLKLSVKPSVRRPKETIRLLDQMCPSNEDFHGSSAKIANQ